MVTKSRGTRLPSSQSPREVGVSWWRRSAENQRYVVASSEQPGGAASRFLRQEGYVVEVAGGKVWILKTPDRDDVRELCLANYWSIVRLILEQYVPAIVNRCQYVLNGRRSKHRDENCATRGVTC